MECVKDPSVTLGCLTCGIVGLGAGDKDWEFHVEWAKQPKRTMPKPTPEQLDLAKRLLERRGRG
jgi:hypothetical protein